MMLPEEPSVVATVADVSEHLPLKAMVTPDGMLEAKVLAMVVLGVVAAVIAFLPLLFAAYVDRRSASGKPYASRFFNGEFSFMFPFGGGVLLCTIFLHLLPEVTENVESLTKLGILPEIHIALPELLTCCGFFVMLFVDGITHSILHRYFHPKPSPSPHLRKISTVQDTQLQLPAANGDGAEGLRNRGLEPGTAEPKPHDHDHHHHDHSHSVTHMDHLIISKVSLVRCFLFVLALSVHEFFEGLAIGLESRVNAVYYLQAAVASHKLVIALCIGVEMVTTRIKFASACTYIFTYAAVSPAGILVGMFILNDASSGSEVNLIASALLQGLATGTLLYVVFFEVLTKTMSKSETGLMKMFAILVGFLAMLGLQLLLDEDEDD
nr:PREDICTED: zinc transporter ZIP3-like [Bemisia tabaci]